MHLKNNNKRRSAAYVLYLFLEASLGTLPGLAQGRDDWGVWHDDHGLEALLAHACCLVLGVGMVYYLARADEMALREHFKCQHLGAHLFQAVRPVRPLLSALAWGWSVARDTR